MIIDAAYWHRKADAFDNLHQDAPTMYAGCHLEPWNVPPDVRLAEDGFTPVAPVGAAARWYVAGAPKEERERFVGHVGDVVTALGLAASDGWLDELRESIPTCVTKAELRLGLPRQHAAGLGIGSLLNDPTIKSIELDEIPGVCAVSARRCRTLAKIAEIVAVSAPEECPRGAEAVSEPPVEPSSVAPVLAAAPEANEEPPQTTSERVDAYVLTTQLAIERRFTRQHLIDVSGYSRTTFELWQRDEPVTDRVRQAFESLLKQPPAFWRSRLEKPQPS